MQKGASEDYKIKDIICLPSATSQENEEWALLQWVRLWNLRPKLRCARENIDIWEWVLSFKYCNCRCRGDDMMAEGSDYLDKMILNPKLECCAEGIKWSNLSFDFDKDLKLSILMI